MKTNDITVAGLGGETQTVRHLHFDSVADAEAAPVTEANAHHAGVGILDPDADVCWNDTDDYDPQHWFGVASRREALAIIAGSGWAEGVRRVYDKLGTLTGLNIEGARSIKRRGEWAADGDDLDLDRLRSGQLDIAWRRRRRQKRTQPGGVVRLINDMCAACDENADDIFWAGAATLYLADTLEEAGYRVEIVTANRCGHQWRDGTTEGLISITLKDSQEPVSPDQVAATLCFAAFYRTVGFHAALTTDQVCTGHWGYVKDLTAEELAAAGLYEPGDVIVPQLRSAQAAERFLSQFLAGFHESPKEGNGTSGVTSEPAATLPAPKISVPPASGNAPIRIYAEGGTYAHKAELKAAGFRWDAAGKRWTALGDSRAVRELRERGLAGVHFTEEG